MRKKVISLISTELVVTCHGLRCLSSLLKKHGHSTRLIFLGTLERQYNHKILRQVKDLIGDSDLIGISCYSQTSHKAIQLIEALRSLKIPIVWGGCHATLDPEDCIRYADIVCVGEGEGALVDLSQFLDDKAKLRTITNLWVKENGNIYKNNLRPLISCLDDLPWEDHDFTSQYFLEKGKFLSKYRGQRIGAQSYLEVLSKLGRKGFSVLFSRGCPFSCAYCFMHDYKLLYRGINSNVFRRKSTSASIAEIRYYKEIMCLNEKRHFISFDDDDFFCQPLKELEQFCLEYRNKINIPFGCHVHINSFDEEKLKLLIDAGLRIITAGIQSGSDRINREIYNRDVENSRVLEAAGILQKYHRYFFTPPSYHVINSNPYETEEDVWQTINLLNSFPKPFNVQIFQLSFFPNSCLTKKAIADGVVSESKELAFDIHYYDAISYAKRRKNYRYGWFVLNLLTGVHARSRLGSVSQKIFRILSNKKFREFLEKHVFLVRLLTYSLLFNRDYHYKRYALPDFMKRYYYFRKKY